MQDISLTPQLFIYSVIHLCLYRLTDIYIWDYNLILFNFFTAQIVSALGSGNSVGSCATLTYLSQSGLMYLSFFLLLLFF